MPIDREKVLQAAQKHVEKKKYDAAIVEYQKLVQDDPHDARTLLKIGDLQARLRAYPEAIATYDRVGQHYTSQGFALKAIAVYKQIREIIRKHAPDLADRYAHIVPRLADIYTELGLTSDALAAWDEVATRLQRAGRDREAVDVFRKMVALDRGNPLPHLRLAEACCRVQTLDEAIDSFWAAADLLLKLGRQDDALKVIERILHFRADARYARVAAELYLAKGGREEGLLALAKLQICFQANSKDLDTLGLLGQAFTRIGQGDKAIEVYKEMARVARDQGRVDVFDGLLEHLRRVAPNDEQVRALSGSTAPRAASTRPSSIGPGASVSSIPAGPSPLSVAPTNAPPPITAPPDSAVALDEGELELIEDTLAPVPLRGGRPPSAPPEVVIEARESSASDLPLDADEIDVGVQLEKALEEAESFRKMRLFPKAIETLRHALELDPRALEHRQKLREILLDSGERAGAASEAVNLAALYIERGNRARAEALLVEAVATEPLHEGARALLAQIAPARLQELPGAPDTAKSDRPSYEGFDSSAPLASYDLEEISPDRALSRSPSVVPVSPDGVTQSYANDATRSELLKRGGAESGRLLPIFEEELDEISQVEEVPRGVSHPELEDVLEEAEFFVARGLFDDARSILQEQLTRTPKHRLVLERLAEVEAQSALAAKAPSKHVGARAPSTFDVSASLDALDRIEIKTEGLAAHNRPITINTNRVSPDQVFANFKAGIRADVSEGDSATHYDLGVAYKEMGLVSDAIHELELAALDPNRECMCYAMIGMIHLEQRQLDRATESYLRALSAQVRSNDQELNLYYDLGSAYELAGKLEEALESFQTILRRAPAFRDVRDRIQSLSKGDKMTREPSGTRAVASDDDDFERVFDDLFEGTRR